VKNGGIECPCHGSVFNLDGTVAHGPAKAPLAAQPIMVCDGQIVTT
jgi:Rieske Fe-S protein